MVTKRGVCPIEDYGYEAIEKVIDMITGKWKLRILYLLTKYECLRYGEYKSMYPVLPIRCWYAAKGIRKGQTAGQKGIPSSSTKSRVVVDP